MAGPDPEEKLAKRIQGEQKKNGASEEVRTLDIHLGKLVLYQLSYARVRVEVQKNENP